MKGILCIAFSCSLAAALPALGASDDSNAKAGVNASTEGSASLGGTGIGTGAGTALPNKGERDGKIAIPAQHKDPESRGELPPSSASAGSSAETSAPGGTDLGIEAEKEDKEIRRNLGKPPGKPSGKPSGR
jgi:hypothetical protein